MLGLRGYAVIAAMLATTITGNAQAASDCWSAQEISAARVRDLQSMLMVAGLRCRGTGDDVLVHYNRFVNANRAAITAINTTLKAHFHRAHGSLEGVRQYDRFTTALANAYGAGGGGSGSCREMMNLAQQASLAGGSTARLIAIADEWGVNPQLPVRGCAVAIATK